MKQKNYTLRAVITLCALIGWWGMLFPELTLTPDTVQITNSSGTVIESDAISKKNLYWELLHADKENISYCFKFTETISSFWEAFKNGS